MIHVNRVTADVGDDEVRKIGNQKVTYSFLGIYGYKLIVTQ